MTPEEAAGPQGRESELYHMYRRGWVKGASGSRYPAARTFREDLRQAYQRGYADGLAAYEAALAREVVRLDYHPSPLRDTP